jgi:hypothetical protein
MSHCYATHIDRDYIGGISENQLTQSEDVIEIDADDAQVYIDARQGANAGAPTIRLHTPTDPDGNNIHPLFAFQQLGL